MTDTQQTTVSEEKKLSRKKQVRREVYNKLVSALAGYKTDLGEKKFENKLKKVSKLFAVDIAKATGKNSKRKTKKKIDG